MIDGKRILAIIPARGGSKGLPGKNILPLGGKPLIAWTIEAARGSRYLDRIIVSTDDVRIAETAAAYDCEIPFMRPAHLAADTSPTFDTLLHALDHVGSYDLLMLLQPTSPLRTSVDIDKAIELLMEFTAPSCVSVTESEKSPYWMFECTDSRQLRPVIQQGDMKARRQDLPSAYVLNGAIYVAHTDWLIKRGGYLDDDTLAYVMPRHRSLDIDDALDLKLAEVLLANAKSPDMS